MTLDSLTAEHLEVPFNAIPGAYRLKVEGNHEGDLGGAEFSNETLVGFSERFLTILIQTNQLVYNIEQMNIGFRSRRPTRVLLLTARHYALRLAWSHQHQHWTVDDWKHAA
ncbi:uncharacterized protein TNCV_3463701 [Trichonephila clavipes]|nr:uncharacterized protein TNCV_3463701 [Trichonephila clavipes]